MKRIEPEEITDARRERIDAEGAWALLKSARSIAVARGKKVQRFEPDRDGREAILQAVMGPSGNLRAPTFRVGNDFVVGFNRELYDDWVK